jgi:NitT/TauT family transport system ATP-binding protein
VGLVRPRDRRGADFEALVDHIYAVMTGRPIHDELARPAPAETGDGRSVTLPQASVDGFSGLLEILHDAGGVADIADLADDLSLEVDDLLPLVDACRLLGFATADGGELRITPLGRGFADAGIQESKRLFARAATEHVPLVRTIRRALQRADDGALKEAFFLDLLQAHYSAADARAQLDVAIAWGRYGELYEYAADTAEITLDVEPDGR